MNELAAIEQADRIKKWCREYGIGIISGIILVTLFSWSWNYWRQSQENHLIIASMQYEHLLTAVKENNNIKTLNTLTDGLLKNYSYTPYASLAVLQLVKQAVKQNNLSLAENKLRWIIQHGEDKTLRSIAYVRLARVLLAENQAEKALNILTENTDKAYIPVIFEEKGDILIHLGKSKEALQSYLAAKQAFSVSRIERPVLEMKVNTLA